MALVIQIIICSFAMVLAFSMIIQILLNGKKTDNKIMCVFYISSTFIWCSGALFLSLYYNSYTWFEDHQLTNILKLIDLYKYLSIDSQAVFWLLFCLSYSYKTLSSIEKTLYKYKWMFFIPGLISYLFLINNENHHLIYYFAYNNGKWYMYLGLLQQINAQIDTFYYLWGVITLIRHIVKVYPYNKKQWIVIMISAYIPHLIGNIYYATSLFQKYDNFDIVPFLFLITLLVFNFAIFKYKFLNITPVAFAKMADELSESILILDADGMVTYFNRSFTENFSNICAVAIDDDIRIFTGYLYKNLNMNSNTINLVRAIESQNQTKIDGEIYLSNSNKHFIVNIQPLYMKKDYIGQIITFYNITEYKKLVVEVESKNHELELANIQLREHANAVKELAVAKERNRLAGDVHDSVGHTMTVLISLIGVCSIACDKDIETVKKKLNEMMDVAINGHNQLKKSVQGIISEEQDENGIAKSINNLIADFEKTGVIVDFSVFGNENNNMQFYKNTIYRICQEALTNALRHGKASYVSIILRLSEDVISLYIIDDGVGCKNLKKNIGLSHMENRVMELGGKISFGSDGEKGFNISVEFVL